MPVLTWALESLMILPLPLILRAEFFDEALDSDSDVGVQLLEGAGSGYHVMHDCSAPDRPGSFAHHISLLGASCRDFDIVQDLADDLTCQVAWMKLADEVVREQYSGLLGGPNCSSFLQYEAEGLALLSCGGMASSFMGSDRLSLRRRPG